MWNYEPLPQHPDPSHCLHPLIKIKKTKQQIENKTQLIIPKLHPKRVRNSTITIYIKLRCLATNKLYTLSSPTTKRKHKRKCKRTQEQMGDQGKTCIPRRISRTRSWGVFNVDLNIFSMWVYARKAAHPPYSRKHTHSRRNDS